MSLLILSPLEFESGMMYIYNGSFDDPKAVPRCFIHSQPTAVTAWNPIADPRAESNECIVIPTVPGGKESRTKVRQVRSIALITRLCFSIPRMDPAQGRTPGGTNRPEYSPEYRYTNDRYPTGTSPAGSEFLHPPPSFNMSFPRYDHSMVTQSVVYSPREHLFRPPYLSNPPE
ncbi:hypothetical protein EMPG_16283 [Blastomyces silverae]|uniref:Uncharacterized protein n=1 Tax=Blastomyces silverae TaxID=2060906 RepID=A0A0H1BAZ7_9EURO|nr:hypothetical protein EMPG_16283 [Blastomyces silverae]